MTENPHGYWCRKCGRSREYADKHCSSAECRERMKNEDYRKSVPDNEYSQFRIFRSRYDSD